MNNSVISYSLKDLQLLSINKARKILGIRANTLKDLIYRGNLETLKIGNTLRTPTGSLKKFVIENSSKIIHDEKSLEEDIREIIRNIRYERSKQDSQEDEYLLNQKPRSIIFLRVFFNRTRTRNLHRERVGKNLKNSLKTHFLKNNLH